ncbi:MAG: type 1 glutamine amidotransferase [Parcubacteria group bacterium]|nr:type 1 glutamine amidotransferase [Parcubacteria group bacterium]
MDRKIQIVFLDILSDDDNLRQTLEERVQGGMPYGEIYAQALRPLPVEVITIDATKSFILPPLCDVILIGGSAHDPSEALLRPWMQRLKDTIRWVAETRIPMLGVCGGHEFIADALGGLVGENQSGREVGALPVSLTTAGRSDFLFDGLPDTFLAMQSHGHKVTVKPLGATVLAYSAMTDIQALGIGENIRTIQFHAEFSSLWLRRLTSFRKQIIASNLYRDTRATRIIFRNFVQHYFG